MKRKHTMINLGRYFVDDELSIRFTPSVIDRILEVAAIVISVVAFGLACYGIYSLPIKPPILLWLCPFAIPLMTFVLYRLGYASPQKISFPFRITKQNLGMQYLLAVRLSRVLNIILSLMVLCSVLTLVAQTHQTILPKVILLLSLLMLVCLVIYFILAYRYR
ncbi:MAG: hypothetical protein J6A40_02265 [Bacteroides sp.]|nr:hypothetical protein [Bacteroides sp.]MBR4047259.1 hypothetical protein [Bacteroides sp.]